MGHSMGDWNLDGNIDWWMTAIHHNSSIRCDVIGCGFSNTGNLFHSNLGNRSMTDVTDLVSSTEQKPGCDQFAFEPSKSLDVINLPLHSTDVYDYNAGVKKLPACFCVKVLSVFNLYMMLLFIFLNIYSHSIIAGNPTRYNHW